MKNISNILGILLQTSNPAKAKSVEVTEKIIFPDATEQITAGDCGLAYCGVVTTVDDATNFKVATLTGFGDHFFKNYYVYVVRDAGGVAPQDELQPISAYASTNGTFTHTAFSVNLTVGDEVLILHKNIAYIDAVKAKTDNIFGVTTFGIETNAVGVNFTAATWVTLKTVTVTKPTTLTGLKMTITGAPTNPVYRITTGTTPGTKRFPYGASNAINSGTLATFATQPVVIPNGTTYNVEVYADDTVGSVVLDELDKIEIGT